jgi:ABC-type Fe3+ transport system permease subunit
MSDRTEPADVSGTTAAGGARSGLVPPQVNAAFWLYIVGAALSLVALIISIATIGSLKDTLQQQSSANGQQLSDSAASAAIGVSVTIAVIFGILYIAAYVLFAFFMRRGANWARIVLLIVTVLSLFGVLGGYGVGAARVIVGVIATILLFTKPANEYFRSARAGRTTRA